MNQQIKTSLGTIIIIIIAITTGAFIWKMQKKQSEILQSIPPIQNGGGKIENPKMCTQEAKQCPDGSSVSRTGPNCEFEACQSTSPELIADWQIYRNEKYGFEFKYPQDWIAEIISDNTYAVDGANGLDVVNTLKPKKQKNCVYGEGGDYSCTDHINFGIVNNANKLTLRDFLTKEYGWNKGSGIIKDNNIQETKLGNGYSYRFTEISGFDGTLNPQFWVTLSDGNFFNVTGSYLDEDQLKIFERVVTSFGFVK